MRTVYLGTSEFAVAVLERLAASEHRPELVVTRPDRPAGRGRRLTPPPVATAAEALGLPLAQPEDVHELDLPPVDALIVCAFGALIKEPLLSRFEIFNVHPSILPRWRGAAPIERAIMAGDTESGVAIMRLVAELDAGPVFAQRREPITPEDDYATLSRRLADAGADLLVEVLHDPPEPVAQSGETTYAEKITADDRNLDPERIDPLVVRALRPHIGARVRLADGSFLGVWDVGPDGELREVQPAGGRRMPADAWLRGHGASLTG